MYLINDKLERALYIFSRLISRLILQLDAPHLELFCACMYMTAPQYATKVLCSILMTVTASRELSRKVLLFPLACRRSPRTCALLCLGLTESHALNRRD